MGMRGLIEEVCQKKFNCKIGKFEEFKKAISDASYLSSSTKGIIIQILDSSHSAVHRAYRPSEEQIKKCLNGIEYFIDQIYIQPIEEEQLKKSGLPKKNGKIDKFSDNSFYNPFHN